MTEIHVSDVLYSQILTLYYVDTLKGLKHT